MSYLEKGPKEHHGAQPQKRPRKVDQEASMGRQGIDYVDVTKSMAAVLTA